jgi:ribonuclease P protein subunit RPR2
MPKRNASQKPSWQKKTVRERIDRLFDQAGECFEEHPERSRRYVEMALKISMRYNVRLGPDLKRRYCRACKAYLVPGKSCTVRTNPGQRAVIITCRECGHVSRHPYRKEKAGKA